MLQIKNLHAFIGDKEILKGINLEIKAGEVHLKKIKENRRSRCNNL
ncbi:hypothetical protein FLBR109950_11510 [Flavobacterium branchiophilum]